MPLLLQERTNRVSYSTNLHNRIKYRYCMGESRCERPIIG